MSLVFLLIKPLLLMMVRQIFKTQMKQFAIEMMEEYSKTTDNDIDDEMVSRIKAAMKLGAV